MNLLALQYVAFVFLSAVGVIQAASAYSGRRGLMFFGNRAMCYLFCALTVAGAFLWFFGSGDRAVLNPRLEGSALFFNFAIGALLAVAATYALSSVINSDRQAVGPSRPSGLHMLREMTFVRAIMRSLGIGYRRGKPSNP